MYVHTGLQAIRKLFFRSFDHSDLHFVPQCTAENMDFQCLFEPFFDMISNFGIVEP